MPLASEGSGLSDAGAAILHADVLLPAGATHTVRPDWPTLGEGPVVIDMDTNGDGVPDETMEIENEGFPVASAPEPLAPASLSVRAFPNPASGAMTLEVETPEAGLVRVALFDVLGRRVAALHDGPLAAGVHALTLDASRLPTGVYMIRVMTPEAEQVRRMTIAR